MQKLTLPLATNESLAESRQWAGIDPATAEPVKCDPPEIVVGDLGTWIRWILGLFDR